MTNGRTAIAEVDGVQFIQLHTPDDDQPACGIQTDHKMVGSFGVAINTDHPDWCDDCHALEGGVRG